MSGGATVGRLYAPATAVVTSPSTGEVTLRQRWDTQLPAGWPTFFDPRVHAIIPLTERRYLGGHLSLFTVGLALHYVPVRPLVLTLGGQTDSPLVYRAYAYPGVAWEAEASALVQPIFGRYLQLLAGAGLTFGDRRQSVLADPLAVGIDNPFAAEVRILRRELRADLLAGVAVFIGRTRARVLVAAQPLFVLGNPGAPQGECKDCISNVTLVSYSSSWRIAMTVSLVVSN